ncbi:MAG TPA: methionyl-tRNA formyltransferase [Clostridiales bacterium]|nr:methionyl-tRNA formyltransferase [Clostridiales bacterium]
MKILYMGTPDFAATILLKLIESNHEIIGVVTQPDKQKGRGKAISFPPVKELALEHNISVYQPLKAREPEFIDLVRKMAPDAIVVAAFGQILPKELLEIPQYGCINVHGSLLPKYRGAAPIQYSIIDGEDETGITIMHMDVGIDTGDMIIQAKTPIEAGETGGSLHDKLAILGGDLLVEALEKISSGTDPRIPQEESKATYVKILHKNMGIIDFNKPAIEIERLIRGLNPWPSAFTYINNKTLKLWKASVEAVNIAGKPGEVIEVRKDAILVMTAKDALLIHELQLEGKKRLLAEEFLRGNNIALGTILGNQSETN